MPQKKKTDDKDKVERVYSMHGLGDNGNTDIRHMSVIGQTMTSWGLTPVNLNSATATKARIKKYLNFCQDNHRDPSPVGLANWLGVSRSTMNGWRAGKFGSTPGEQVIQDALMMLEEIWYQAFMDNKNLPTAYIFMGKNWFGYKDSQDVVVTPNKPLGEEPNEDELRRRIAQEVIVDEQNIIDLEPVEPGEDEEG